MPLMRVVLLLCSIVACSAHYQNALISFVNTTFASATLSLVHIAGNVLNGTLTPASSAGESQSAIAPATDVDLVGVFTYRNDNSRSGLNSRETVLTPKTVNSSRFGKLFTYTVDGYVYAQPLYVSNVDIPNQGVHNVVYVATENNSVYAFDAEGKNSTPLWYKNLNNAATGSTPVPCADVHMCSTAASIGITATPVISPGTNTMYVVARFKMNGKYIHRIHALDIRTGFHAMWGSKLIQATVSGNGEGGNGSTVSFNGLTSNNRAALLRLNGVVYVAFGSPDDVHPYHGWIIGYAPNNTTKTLDTVAVFNPTPNGQAAGIWSPAALAADAQGNMFCSVGQGTWDVPNANLGDSFLRLTTNGGVLQVADYFTPFNQSILDAQDLDVGSGGTLLLPSKPGTPHPDLIVAGGKEGRVYLLDRQNLGHFQPGSDSQIVQSISGQFPNGVYTTPAYFAGRVYIGGSATTLKAFSLTDGRLSTSPVSQSSTSFFYPGANPVVSSNGLTNGIVWALERPGTGILHAYDATNLSKELYNSNQVPSRDALQAVARFSVPTVANGRVYVASNDLNDNQGKLFIFGLLP